ncbi:OsmC family protein [Carnobacteriaceae bacterium zg-84]|uniref:OsmC family protein n=1 Tax=Granulicatella sp. zg-84 TaxID=2678503 RepID=UPI0013C08755|nr:OsmC family protein [Granulicatella sp. zg-84]NEW65724.1 hypothetical protein [Granulicatella sp. zg-84]QMI86522.1 OsmC family protein [Carnobacteriaceae bacterium zg-84]
MLYTTTATNTDGINGLVFLSDFPEKIKVSHPLDNDLGFNPEQLIALSWSTCLNATIQSLLKARGYAHINSKVDVTVDLQRESNGVGFFFDIKAVATIWTLPLDIATDIVESAHQRCPVSKLIKDAKTVQLSVQIAE